MWSNTYARAALAGVMLVGLTAGAAMAQPWDKRTQFTFSGPTQVPGVTLPAGSYVFRLVDTSGHNVIQVLSADGQRSYSIFFGIRALRSDSPAQPELRFIETAPGVSPAVQSWWYPGERNGFEFVYPKDQARRLASASGRPVLTTVQETKAPPETGVGDYGRIAPGGETLPAEAPAPPATAVQRGELPPPTMAYPEPSLQARADLPKTASVLPLAGMGAVALLLGAAAIRRWRLAIG